MRSRISWGRGRRWGLPVEGEAAAGVRLRVSDKFPIAGVTGVFGATLGTVWRVRVSDKLRVARWGASRVARTDPRVRVPVSDNCAAGASADPPGVVRRVERSGAGWARWRIVRDLLAGEILQWDRSPEQENIPNFGMLFRRRGAGV